jgi:hypothetical protein
LGMAIDLPVVLAFWSCGTLPLLWRARNGKKT